MYIVILVLILLLLIIFIRDIKENFFFAPNFLWMPTRSTRLMSYDLRGDPFGYYVYPSYYSWGAPFQVYLYSPARYDINGRYIIPKPKNMAKKDKKNIKMVENKIKPKQ